MSKTVKVIIILVLLMVGLCILGKLVSMVNLGNNISTLGDYQSIATTTTNYQYAPTNIAPIKTSIPVAIATPTPHGVGVSYEEAITAVCLAYARLGEDCNNRPPTLTPNHENTEQALEREKQALAAEDAREDRREP
jgi:hypothetical protein